MIGSNPRAGLVAAGRANYSRSHMAIDAVIAALRENVPIEHMKTNSESGEKIPLDIFLAKTHSVGEIQAFFTGAPMFNIWETLPLGLEVYRDKIGVSDEEASKLLDRFNAYTWNDIQPELKNKYMSAIRNTLWVSGNEFNDWRAYQGSPRLVIALDTLLDHPEISGLKSFYDLKSSTEEVRKIEKEVEQIPPERIRDIFTPSGHRRMDLRERMVKELDPLMKEKAKRIIEPLTQVGAEYRALHIARYHPQTLQLSLFDRKRYFNKVIRQ